VPKTSLSNQILKILFGIIVAKQQFRKLRGEKVGEALFSATEFALFLYPRVSFYVSCFEDLKAFVSFPEQPMKALCVLRCSMNPRAN